MKLNLKFEVPIHGEGKNLFTVTHVDETNTMVEFWLSDTEEELYETLMNDIIGDTEFSDEELKEMKERYDFEVWGVTILINKIAKVK